MYISWSHLTVFVFGDFPAVFLLYLYLLCGMCVCISWSEPRFIYTQLAVFVFVVFPAVFLLHLYLLSGMCMCNTLACACVIHCNTLRILYILVRAKIYTPN